MKTEFFIVTHRTLSPENTLPILLLSKRSNNRIILVSNALQEFLPLPTALKHCRAQNEVGEPPDPKNHYGADYRQRDPKLRYQRGKRSKCAFSLTICLISNSKTQRELSLESDLNTVLEEPIIFSRIMACILLLEKCNRV